MKNRITLCSSNSTSGHNPQRMESTVSRDSCILIFVAALFTAAKGKKQSECPSTDEQINKMWSILTIEYYSGLKRQEILTHAMTCTNIKDKMLNEVSQSEKDKYWMVSLI